MKKIFVATIQIAIEAKSEEEVTNLISINLSEHNPWLLDWQYLKIDGQFLHPTEALLIPTILDYEEGRAFL